MTSECQHNIHALLVRLLENEITDAEIEILNKWMAGDPKSIGLYCEYLRNYAIVKRIMASEIDLKNHFTDYGFNQLLWNELLAQEQSAPAVELPKAQPQQELVTDVRQRMQHIRREQQNKSINKPFLFGTLVSLVATFLVIAYLQLSPLFIRVATVKDYLNIQFADNKEVAVGNRLTNRREFYQLKSGIIEIEFDYGARVIIEAPAEFRLDSCNSMFLNSGRLYAKVPGQAIGFIVDTPNSRVVDLGTEFGINVSDKGNSDIHMLKGKATLIPGAKGKTQNGQTLTVGDAKRIDAEFHIEDIPIEEKKFVRVISSRDKLIWKGEPLINLADIVGGGSGFGTGHINTGIDPATGLFGGPKDAMRRQNNYYVPVASSAFIDGVFVPNGSPDQVISSTGLLFRNCPITSGSYYADIINTPSLLNTGNNSQGYPVMLGGVNYSTSANRCIFLHSNLGITFDLDVFRSCLPEAQIAVFSSHIGISKAPARRSAASFWILVDGQIRYHKEFTSDMPAELIRIPLDIADRYLTLITTENVNANLTNSNFSAGFKWCIFGNPVLFLE